MNFREYKTAARMAEFINSGYSAALFGLPSGANPYLGEQAEAWRYGFDLANDHCKGQA